MSDYVPQVGHRVRRTHVVEGVVTARTAIDWARIGGTDWYVYETSGDTTWERLPDAERVWLPGDVVRDAEGVLFVRISGENACTWRSSYGVVFHADYPVRPLTRLVPEVQA